MTKYGMPLLVRETSSRSEPVRTDKPFQYRPPPLAKKRGEAKWRQPEPRREASSGNDRSPRLETPYTPHDYAANQQLREELAELRRMVARNVQPQARRCSGLHTKSLTRSSLMSRILFPSTSKCPHSQRSAEKTTMYLPGIISSSSPTTVWHLKIIPITK